MSFLIRLFRTHSFSLTSFILYALLWCRYLWIQLNFESATRGMIEGNRIAYGEGVSYLMLLVLLIGVIFTITTLLFAALKKGHRRFYLMLGVLLITSIFIFVIIIY
jgi:hypothetical protein